MLSYRSADLYSFICFWLISGTESCDGSSNFSRRQFSVQIGGSITIPCYYDSKHTQLKKFWYSDIDKSRIYTNFTDETVSVIDDPAQSLFTVTMRDLKQYHSGCYSCYVETDGKIPTTTDEVYLNVQHGVYVSVVNSRVTGEEGVNISVQCLYSSGYKNEHKQWCRYKDRSCYTSQNASVQISDDEKTSFTVVMTGLKQSDSGWYYCSVGDLQAPVQLTVTAAATQDTSTEKNNNIKSSSPSPTNICRSETGSSENSSISTFSEQQKNKTFLLWLPVSVVLLLVILAVLFLWKWKKRSEKEKEIRRTNNGMNIDAVSSAPEDPVIYSTINDDENPNVSSAPEDPVTYSTINDDEKPNAISPLDSNTTTTYSTVDAPGNKASPAGGSVYSTVEPH